MYANTQLRVSLAFGALFVLWWLEAWLPYWHAGTETKARLRHAGRNLSVTALHVAMMALAFASATAFIARWAEEAGFGLLRWAPEMPPALSTLVAVVLMDAWMYLWHRLNHVVPFLWRFHKVHHTDPYMDVTTATRFHPMEIAFSAVLRLGVIALLGVSVWQVVLYGLLHLPVIQFQHSNVRLPDALDRVIRVFIVSPTMHRVHHSRYQPETDSNYSSILSFWDRLARTFVLRDDPATIQLGLDGYDDDSWQSIPGMLKTPLRGRVEADEA
jgi:sterol desaturase/sphingolipid hydroxylase (fatty acid hydroxylase superfamily)